MENDGYVLLKTEVFDEFISQRASLVQRYDNIKDKYDNIVKELLNNWEGKGAEEFENDANMIRKNIGGIYDILKTMCDILQDCKEVYSQCDKGLGDYNRNPH